VQPCAQPSPSLSPSSAAWVRHMLLGWKPENWKVKDRFCLTLNSSLKPCWVWKGCCMARYVDAKQGLVLGVGGLLLVLQRHLLATCLAVVWGGVTWQ
jgi:hypothetical protein